MKRAARVDSYRGFVFASLAADGPTLPEFLGDARIAFDDMCDRSPLGEVEVVPICHRVMQHSNWKFFMENQLDALHPSVTHQSTGIAAGRVEKRAQGREGRGAAATTTTCRPSRRASSSGTRCRRSTSRAATASSRPTWACARSDPDTLEYEALLKQAYGEAKTEEYLSRSIHHVLVYPYLSVQSPLQQLRCLRPIAPDKTLSEIWHFRLKGAPEAIYRRSLWYYNLVNSPATMINADDLENWTKGQWGLQSNGGDWVSFHRYYGDDREENGVTYSNHGTSEAVMRNQFKAWSKYMQAPDGARRCDAKQRHDRAIPSAGARLRAPARAGRGDRRRGDAGAAPARSAIAPDHSPRATRRRHRRQRLRERRCRERRPGVAGDLQREVEQFLYLQAELLDGKHWQAWIDLFAADGVYWMPVTPEQTEWEGSPSIFAEDKLMMEIRKGRVSHPNAWSQAPQWETNHLVSHVAIESADGDDDRGALALPHDGAAARRDPPFRRHATATRWCATRPARCASSCSASTCSTARRRSTTCCRSGSELPGLHR